MNLINFRHTLAAIHRFLQHQGAYPLLLATALAGLLILGRFIWSRQFIFYFLIWNLFLAWLPYWCSLWIAYRYERNSRLWLLLFPSIVWLLFFPNAPYLVTDLIHLQYIPPIPIWYDLFLLSAFAWAGLFLAVYSLKTMQGVIRGMAGPLISWLFVFGMVGLSGFGVYLGRFLRWNSWDVIVHPKAILLDILARLIDPLSHPHTYGVTLFFAAFLLVCYLTITSGSSNNDPSWG